MLIEEGNIILSVRSKHKQTPCHICQKPAIKRNGYAPIRKVRHLPIFEKPVYLEITPVRYICDECDDHPTTTEAYDWCSKNASITHGLQEYIMRQMIHSTIEDTSKKTMISCKTIQTTIDHFIPEKIDWEKCAAITTIGIDEIAVKKGHDQL